MGNMFDLSGRVAVVSGTASGMGEAMAMTFAENGADLVLLDMNTAGNEETAHAIEKMGRRAIPLTIDVSKYSDIDRVYETVDKEFGHIDILSNVAGNGKQGAADEMTMDDVMYVFQNLVLGRFYNTQQAGRRMLKQGRGSIMSLGSIAGVSSLGRQQAVYGMAMAAVIHMTKELSTEWSGRGVRVNAILPAQTVGPKTQAGWDARMSRSPGLKETFLHGIPIGRFGSPDDIRGLALWLASDASSFITGVIIPMDGGNLAMNAGGGYISPSGVSHSTKA